MLMDVAVSGWAGDILCRPPGVEALARPGGLTETARTTGTQRDPPILPTHRCTDPPQRPFPPIQEGSSEKHPYPHESVAVSVSVRRTPACRGAPGPFRVDFLPLRFQEIAMHRALDASATQDLLAESTAAGDTRSLACDLGQLFCASVVPPCSRWYRVPWHRES